jgi:hypothetical protein
MRRKYLSVFGEYAASIYAYMEKMAIWGYLRYTKSSLNTQKVFKRIRRIRGKNLCVDGEDAKRVLTYSPNTPVPLTFGFAQLAKGKSLGRSKPATNSQAQALATHYVDCFYYIQVLQNCLL